MRRSLTTQLTVTLGVVCAVVLAGFVVMTVATRKLRDDDKARGRSTSALTTANQLEQSVLDLETGLRGYLLAGKPVFLQPYDAALRAYPRLVAALETATAAYPVDRALTRSIASSIHAYVTGWTEPVIREARTNLPAARAAEAGGAGKARVDAMRAQFATLVASQSNVHSAQVTRASSLATFVFVAGLLACVLFVVTIVAFAVRTQRRVVAPLRRLAVAVAGITGGDLSVRVPAGGDAEVGELVGGFNRMATSLEDQRSELEAQRSELEDHREELEAALESLEERSDHIDLLRRLGDRLATEHSVEDTAAAALDGIASAGACEVGAAYLLDSKTQAFTRVAHRGLDGAQLESVLTPGDTLAGRALAERKRVCVSYGEATMQVTSLGYGRPAVHELHLPVLYGDRMIGVFSLGRLEDRPFSEGELQLLDDLAARAALGCSQALAMRRLRRTADELGALLESTDQGVYGIDTGGKITLVNRAALEMTGFTREELLGRNSHEMLHHAHEDGMPYPQEECPVFRSCQTGEGVRITSEVYWRRDGTPFPVEYSAYPLFEGDEITGAVVTFLDRTARRQAQRQRDTQHALTRVFAEVPSLAGARPQMLAAVCEGLGFEVGLSWEPSDEDGVLAPVSMYAAPGFEDLLDVLGGDRLPTRGTLAGLAIARRDPVVCGDLERDPARPNLAREPRLRAGVGLPVRTRDGTLVSVAEMFSSRPVAEEGLVETLQALATQVAQHVERARDAEETQRMKDQIVSNVSHELRTPLTAIDGWVHVLLGEEPGPLNDDQRRFLTTVKRNSDRLMRLVGDLLVAGQIEAGKLKLELETVDVAELARETAELLAQNARSKRIALTVNADAPAMVEGDRQRLGQLLTNLISNAVKFTPEEGSVDLGVQRHNGSCRITVRDTGIGIPPADREHLFERFYRASSATAHGIGGTGLGLAISKAIAESHHGTLRIADGDGPGTEFVVELPITIREEAYT